MTDRPSPLNRPDAPLTAEQQAQKRGLRIFVDPKRCIANAKCTTAAPGVFVLDEETGIAVIENEDQATVAQFFAAARVCPTQAIIIEQYGRRVFPRILPPMWGDKPPGASGDAEEADQE